MVGVLGVSASAILVRFSQAPSGVTAAYRLGWTVLLLLPVVLLRCRAELRRVTARDLVLCGASGVLLALHFLTWFESLKRTSVASSTVLVSTEVIFTALGFALFLHGKIPRLGVWAILLAFGGSALLALSGGGGAGELSGNLLALAAASAAAVYTLIGRIQRGHLSTTVYTFLTYLACFLTLLLGTAAAGTPLTAAGSGSSVWRWRCCALSWDTACLAGASSTCPHPTCPPQSCVSRSSPPWRPSHCSERCPVHSSLPEARRCWELSSSTPGRSVKKLLPDESGRSFFSR